jgi:hypothetical protein
MGNARGTRTALAAGETGCPGLERGSSGRLGRSMSRCCVLVPGAGEVINYTVYKAWGVVNSITAVPPSASGSPSPGV